MGDWLPFSRQGARLPRRGRRGPESHGSALPLCLSFPVPFLRDWAV